VATLTLSVVAGQSVADISQNVVGSLGWNDITMPHPVFEGDTVRSHSTILKVRESTSRPHAGIVPVHTEGYNQNSQTVISYNRTVMVYRNGFGPRFQTEGTSKA
jgi:acyl dehydratase